MRHRQLLLPYTVMIWLTLLLCLVITIDWVEDSVLEDTDIVEGLTPDFEKAENPDEHLLLRSTRADGSALTIVTLPPSADSATGSFSLQPVTALARATSACHDPPARSSPVSFTTPLRI